VVLRMLLSAKADLSLEDSANVSALDAVRAVSGSANSEEDALRIRQLLNEVTEMPTVDVVVLEGQEPVRRALFADMQNDKIVFHTDSSIGIYSLVEKRILLLRRFKNSQANVNKADQHRALSISVNPELGTVAMCLGKANPEGQGFQTVFIFWPSGQLGGEEEPLKLSLQVDHTDQRGSEPAACALLSRSQGPQMLLAKLQDGMVYSWRLRNQRRQIVSETELGENASRVAVSDDGCWIAVVVHPNGQPPFVQVYSYESPAGLLAEPVVVFKENKNPQAMAIQQQTFENNVGVGNLALAEAFVEGMPSPPPIEIYSISAEGTSSMIYRLKVPSPCTQLDFCHGVVSHMVSSHADGLNVLYDLPRGKLSMCHGSPTTSCLSVSADRTLAIATEGDCFRIFRMPAIDGSF